MLLHGSDQDFLGKIQVASIEATCNRVWHLYSKDCLFDQCPILQQLSALLLADAIKLRHNGRLPALRVHHYASSLHNTHVGLEVFNHKLFFK